MGDKRGSILTIILSLVIFLTGQILHAQDTMDTIIHIREVSVRSVKPMKENALVISSIDSFSLSGNLASGLDQLLATSSILHIRSYGYGALSSASFRGTAPGHTKLYWNDMEINDPASGQVDFSLVPAGFVDELQLLHGSSALHAGGGALGGIIRLNSVADWKEGISSELFQQSGSYNSHYSYARISAGKKDYYGKLRIYRESSDNDFSYINTANGLWNKEKMKGASSLRKGYQVDLYRKFRDKHIFSVHNWMQHSNRNLPPVMSYMGPGRIENQQDATVRLSVRWKYYGTWLNSKLSSGFSLNELNYFLAENESSARIFNTHSLSGNFFMRHEAESNFSDKTRIRSVIDMDYISASYNDMNTAKGFNASRPGAGWTLVVHHRFDFPVTAYALMREEWTGGIFSPLMPAAGMDFTPPSAENLSFKANVSRNYNYPGLNDMYWIPGGNPELRPEEGYMGDLTARYSLHIEGFEFKSSVTAFYSAINDWILWKPGEYGFWQAKNLEKVTSSGLEYLLNAAYSSGKTLLRLQATYAWTRAHEVSTPGNEGESDHLQLIYMPENKVNMNLMIKTGSLKLNYNFLYSGKQFTTTDNDPFHALPGYSLHDIKLSGEFKISGIIAESGIGVNNILDTSYQVMKSRPMPGRNLNAFMKINF